MFVVGSYDLELDIDPFFFVIITLCWRILDSPGVSVGFLVCSIDLRCQSTRPTVTFTAQTQSPSKRVQDASSPTVRRMTRKADHSPPPTAEVRMHAATTPLPHTSSSWPAAWYSTQNLHYAVDDDHLLGCDAVDSFTLMMEVAESFETAVQYQPSERHYNDEVTNGHLDTNSVEEQEAYTGSSKKMDGIWNRYNLKKVLDGFTRLAS